MSKKRFQALRMDEIYLEFLESHNESDSDNETLGDVIIVPPDVDGLTDEEDIGDEEETGEVVVQDVPGSLELHIETDHQNEVQLDENNDFQKPSKASRGKKRKLSESVPKWRYVEPKYSKAKERDYHHQTYLKGMKDALETSTPVQIFEELITPEIYDHIAKETVRYATSCKNIMDFTINADELKVFIGILLFSSYHKLPSERHYWSNDEDLGISRVKNAMSRNRFQMLKNCIHFVDNAEADKNKHDKGFKIKLKVFLIRPLDH